MHLQCEFLCQSSATKNMYQQNNIIAASFIHWTNRLHHTFFIAMQMKHRIVSGSFSDTQKIQQHAPVAPRVPFEGKRTYSPAFKYVFRYTVASVLLVAPRNYIHSSVMTYLLSLTTSPIWRRRLFGPRTNYFDRLHHGTSKSLHYGQIQSVCATSTLHQKFQIARLGQSEENLRIRDLVMPGGTLALPAALMNINNCIKRQGSCNVPGLKAHVACL